ncbi:MAG: GNAT family N-acetyltransferase [Bryobacteraceae bacterium]
MTISVHPVESESQSQELIDTLQANLPHLPHARLFPWLYLRNPEGRALVWHATNSETGRMIAVAAAFPRRVYVRGEAVRGYVLGDFCVDAGHRSLGLALALQRACLEGLSRGDTGFAFDFPSQTMLAIYKRLQIEVNATMIRYAKPLRADRKVADRVPVPAIARGLTLAANAALILRDVRMGRSGDWAIAADPGPWGEEFTRAAREWSSSVGVCVARTAEYLNWRFREHPLQKYEMLTARQGSRLSGYLIHHSNGEDWTIADLFAEDDGARSVLLTEATTIARKHGAHTVSVAWLATHSGRRLLEENGFRPRESSPVVLVGLPQPAQRPVQPEKDQWFLTSGDWES